jgi:hypothetical protein
MMPLLHVLYEPFGRADLAVEDAVVDYRHDTPHFNCLRVWKAVGIILSWGIARDKRPAPKDMPSGATGPPH